MPASMDNHLTINVATHFIDLFAGLDRSKLAPALPPFTENGLHLNRYGYRRAAEVIAAGLGWEPHAWRVGPAE